MNITHTTQAESSRLHTVLKITYLHTITQCMHTNRLINVRTSAASGRTFLPAVSQSSRTPEHLALALTTTGPAGESCVHEESCSLDHLTVATDSPSPVAIHGQSLSGLRVSRQVLGIGRADSLARTRPPTADRGFKRTAMLAPPLQLQRRQTASWRISISQLLAGLRHGST
jgi:hypothetical protein